MRYLFTLPILIPAVLGCDSAPDVASTPTCEAPLVAVAFTADSTAAICLLPEFTSFPGSSMFGDRQGSWARGTLSHSGYAWLRLAVLDSTDVAQEWGVPPAPRSLRQSDPPDVIHAVRADSVAVHVERIEGRLVDVEVGLVSGGFQGAVRQPSLRAVWPIDGARWILIQGTATGPATLDSMRAMVRTVRVKPAGRGS